MILPAEYDRAMDGVLAVKGGTRSILSHYMARRVSRAALDASGVAGRIERLEEERIARERERDALYGVVFDLAAVVFDLATALRTDTLTFYRTIDGASFAEMRLEDAVRENTRGGPASAVAYLRARGR